MNLSEAKAVIEALIFASSEPLSLKEIAGIMQINEHTIEQLLIDLIDEYEQAQKGIRIQVIAGGYHFMTAPACAEYVEKLKKIPRSSPLSQAALETLAIIAYRQPITRAEIEALRGVRVESSLTTLLEKELIQEAGRRETPGRPILYTITTHFLKHFGLNSLDDLPPIEEFTDSALLDLLAAVD